MTVETTTPRLGDDGYLAAYGEAWSSGDQEKLARYFAEDGVYDEVGMGHIYEGVEQVARFFRYMLRFSSDTDVAFTSLVRDGSSFVAEWVWSGTADGPLRVQGVTYPATGQRYSVRGAAVCETNDGGLIVRHSDYYDVGTLMRQVGVI